jgi:acetolactate synthase I/II/III large subunit
MKDRAASTLLHLGPGFANGMANLHNAKRAHSLIVNIVGEHAIYHRQYDSPLTSDIQSAAGTVSAWVGTAASSHGVAPLAAEAVAQANGAPGRIATMILPAHTAWGEGSGAEPVPVPIPRVPVTEGQVAAAALRQGQAALFLGDRALRTPSLAVAARIRAATGCKVLTTFSNARTERGAGRAGVDRIPYPVKQEAAALRDLRHLILVGNAAPVAFFAYPGLPSTLAAPGCAIALRRRAAVRRHAGTRPPRQEARVTNDHAKQSNTLRSLGRLDEIGFNGQRFAGTWSRSS